MKYGFIYETTNLITGMKYIGQHRREQDPSDPDDSWYLGSGKYFTNALLKYGVQNFDRKILCECDSAEELNNKESYYLNLYNCAQNPLYYNMTNSSYLGGTRGYHHSDESKQKIGRASGDTRKGLKLSDSHRASISQSLSSAENRTRQSKNIKGRIKVHNEEIERSIHPEELDNYLSEGWIRGRLPSIVEKIASSNRGIPRPQTEDQKKSLLESVKGTIAVSKGDTTRRINPEELDNYLSDGWVRGMSKAFSENRSMDVRGKVHVYRGEEQKFIYNYELELYLREGWERGLPPNQKAKISSASKLREEKKRKDKINIKV